MTPPDLLQEDSISRTLGLTLDSFIVEAPAGAGKTELLTQRFLKLLQTVASPEEIIAITFTNKAASEMKTRIMDSLQLAAGNEIPTQAHKKITFDLGRSVLARSMELGWNLLNAPSRLRVYTIDSLSANLARQMPLLSRFGTQPAVSDDASVYYLEAANRALDYLDHKAYGAIVQSALRYFDNDTVKLTQLLAEMLAKRDQWLPYSQNPDAAETAEAALASLINADIEAALAALPPAKQQSLMPIARYAAGNLNSESNIALLLDWNETLPAQVASLSIWRAVVDLLLTKDGLPRKENGLNIKFGFPPNAEGKAQKAALIELIETIADTDPLQRIRSLPSLSEEKNSWQMIATLAQLLHLAVGELWLVFQTYKEVDFVEISQRALLALEDVAGNTTDLALKLDYGIQHLLIDEFQDTSPTQIKLIQSLTNGWQPNDGRTLFCVGDPMQSIYRFRKANVGLFLQVAQQGIGDIQLKSLKLWRNNRSHPEIVEWINQSFLQAFPKEDSITRGAIQYRPFVATKPAEIESGVTFHPLFDQQITGGNDDNLETESLQTDDIRQREAKRIIEIIQKTWAAKPQAKIAVLVRARRHLEALVAEIRRNYPHINFQAVEIEALANRQIVQDLLSLTYAMHQLADRVHWLAVLRAPWCGLTLTDLHTLVADDQQSTVMSLMLDDSRLLRLSEDGQKRLLHVRNVLSQALQQQGRQAVYRWLEGAWLMLGGADCLWDSGDVRDVQAFFKRIQQLELAGKFSPAQLSIEVQKLYAAPDAKADERLQLMTIHKSKGLEFDTVILPGLDRKTSGHDQPLLLWEEVTSEELSHAAENIRLVAAPYVPKRYQNAKDSQKQEVTAYDYLKMLEKERANYEDARVLYVAATRAERCLHLLAAVKIEGANTIKPPQNNFLAMLWPMLSTEALAKQPIAESSQLDNNKMVALTKATPLENFTPQLVRLTTPVIPAIFSSITTHNFSATLAVGNNTASNSIDADIGTLAHSYLEIIAENGLENWPATRIAPLTLAMQRWFKQKGYDANQSAIAALQVIALLEITLNSQDGRWVLATRIDSANELAIESVEHLEISKKVIDRTFIENNIRWIIDYKSVALPPEISDVALTPLAEQYSPQLAGYEQLFKHEGLMIKKAVLFLSLGKLLILKD